MERFSAQKTYPGHDLCGHAGRVEDDPSGSRTSLFWPVAEEGARGRHDVLEQVCGGDGGAWGAQHPYLKGWEQDRPGDPDGRGDRGDYERAQECY
jgi:hypothetical protein